MFPGGYRAWHGPSTSFFRPKTRFFHFAGMIWGLVAAATVEVAVAVVVAVALYVGESVAVQVKNGGRMSHKSGRRVLVWVAVDDAVDVGVAVFVNVAV